jgi:hypothetical protein
MISPKIEEWAGDEETDFANIELKRQSTNQSRVSQGRPKDNASFDLFDKDPLVVHYCSESVAHTSKLEISINKNNTAGKLNSKIVHISKIDSKTEDLIEKRWVYGLVINLNRTIATDDAKLIIEKISTLLAEAHVDFSTPKTAPHTLQCFKQYKKINRDISQKFTFTFDIRILKLNDQQYLLDIQKSAGDGFIFLDFCHKFISDIQQRLECEFISPYSMNFSEKSIEHLLGSVQLTTGPDPAHSKNPICHKISDEYVLCGDFDTTDQKKVTRPESLVLYGSLQQHESCRVGLKFVKLFRSF